MYASLLYRIASYHAGDISLFGGDPCELDTEKSALRKGFSSYDCPTLRQENMGIHGVFLVLFLAASSALGGYRDDCTNVRLDAPGGSMEHVQVTDQGTLGICYAHAGALLVDSWRFSHLNDVHYDHVTSAYYAAVSQTKHDKSDNTIEGGYACPVVKDTFDFGSCSQSYIKGRYAKFDPESYVSLLLDYRREYLNRIDSDEKYRAGHGGEMSHGTLNMYIDEDKQDAVEANAKMLKFLIGYRGGSASKNPDEKTIEGILLNKTTEEDFVKFFVDPVCKSPDLISFISKPLCVDLRAKELNNSAENAKQILHRLLSRKKPDPASILLCSKVYLAGNEYTGVRWTNPQKLLKEDCAPHAALVIGRRWNEKNGFCEFLVRNSYGKGCSKDMHTDWSCEGDAGGLWINESALARNLYGISFLTTGHGR